MHEKSECLADGSRPGADLLEGGQGLIQTEGSVVEPSLKENQPNFSRTGSETGSRMGTEPVSLSSSARMESISMNSLTPQPWKH